MKFSIKCFFSKFDQIRTILRIWPHLLKKSLMENFIFSVQQLHAFVSNIFISNTDGDLIQINNSIKKSKRKINESLAE